jgi:ribosomal protein S18 acetylase RimI-like enzyme
MLLNRFTEADIDPFLALAEGEGWLCDRWEFAFLLQQFPQGCLVLRETGGGPVAYVTSISYGRSGWIGNLIVQPATRRHGIGRMMMEAAVTALLQSGVETIWLTASEQGAELYRRLGFQEIDRIDRWSGRIDRWSGRAGFNFKQRPLIDEESLWAVDQAGWGERREALLKAVLRRGTLYSVPGGFLCYQQWDGAIQLGPWGCQSRVAARQLLDDALTEGYEKVFLDVPAANPTAGSLLVQRGLKLAGSTLLMYYGGTPAYRPTSIFALATMGSIG